MIYEGRKHVGEINYTFGCGEGGDEPIAVKDNGRVIDKKEEKYKGKYWGWGETKCKITRRMFNCQH